MHWGALWADHAEANALTHPAACPDSKQPELKACSVMLVPVRIGEAIAFSPAIKTENTLPV